MSSRPKAVVLGPQDGKTIAVLGNTVTPKVVSADTAGAWSLLEVTYAPVGGFPGPPLHRHDGYDETFYILDGDVTFRLGERTLTQSAGACVFIPRGQPHTFANHAEQPARFLLLLTPAGFEQYFEELAALVGQAEEMPSQEQVAALVEKYGFEVLGPPLPAP
ncbi:MAG: cupin domain-containing protein [Dehalococcoidia bacterium]|nr:cupin domain-containing protein [Dehalococcoidia bacterium]